jgi:circadian clock protein KaiB
MTTAAEGVLDADSRAYPHGNKPWELRLYVTGLSSRKGIAVRENLERICADHLQGHCTVELVDLLETPQRARTDQITAIPTVVRVFPLPVRKLVGTLADPERALSALGLELSGCVPRPAD